MTDPSLPLESDGPHPDLVPEARIFAPFIGRWDLDVTWHDGDEVVRRERGEWHFAWVLEGRAVQDVWIVPGYECGTSVRFHDPDLGAWRSTWIGPRQRSVRTFEARRVGDEVVLDGTDDEGRRLRWSFSAIAADSFSWSNATQRDGKWVVTQRFAATRATA